MAKQNDPGISLQSDLIGLLDDEATHDIFITCADGVTLGASRAHLVTRSVVFRRMLLGEMRESKSGKVELKEIKSDALRIVLLFLYTENIDSARPFTHTIIETYCAATFFMLPKLMKLLILEVGETKQLGSASSLLNEATIAVPPNEHNRDLYEVLLKTFCSRPLEIGDLNDLSETSVETLLLASQDIQFETSELSLLICIVDWVWATDPSAPPADDRCKALEPLHAYSLPSTRIKIPLFDDKARNILSNFIRHIDFGLICPHRMIHLAKAIDVLAETAPQFLASCQYACAYTNCPPGHPTQFRGTPHHIGWDQERLGSSLVVSENGAVLEYPNITPSAAVKSARFGPIAISDQAMFEWDIVIESSGVNGRLGQNIVGIMYGDAFETEKNRWGIASFQGFQSIGRHSIVAKTNLIDDKSSNVYGQAFSTGDVVTFHLNCTTRICSISINGTHYGVAFNSLPDVIYPAVSVYPQARYRLRTRVPLTLPPV